MIGFVIFILFTIINSIISCLFILFYRIFYLFEERLEIQAIADDISSKYVPPHVKCD
jgi:hypothetical protein